ncbi:YcnI family copper-binding membrane protein [Paenibacillus tarimensis]|uniref:YcnI family copper-binding membrane protein n=1 Tax=Paenibacillus tarimensis TaxID=416012 RepID=UPI001F3CE57E|nr:YcnI family protein [Paenibacillus tarimensis]MCF2942922.1 YcnI family protein [Paenibacillus tarimensis]
MKKFTFSLIAIVSAVLMLAGMASAHVTVWPKEVKQGSYEVFTVRVPSEEKGTTTVGVRVTIPESVNITRVEPKAGWSYEIERRADDTIGSVAWAAEGDGLKQTEFTEFRLSGRVNDDAETIVWKAYQTYSDGSVVEWVGAPDADKPASVVTAVPGTGESDGHGQSHGQGTTAEEAADSAPADQTDGAEGEAAETSLTGSESSGNSQLPLVLSIIALVLAMAAFITALINRKRRA